MNTIELNKDSESSENQAKAYLTDERKRGIKQELDNLYDDMMREADDYAADHITGMAIDTARKFLERVLNGDEKAAASLFEIGESGRVRTMGYDEGVPWASVIHGSIFESSAVALRRKLVEAHSETLKDERMKDLESIIEGLRLQIVKLEKERNDIF